MYIQDHESNQYNKLMPSFWGNTGYTPGMINYDTQGCSRGEA